MSNLPHSIFTTQGLSEKDRIPAWRDDISVIFDYEPCSPEDPHPFHVNFDLYHFGHSVLAYLEASTGRYIRPERKVARDGMDAILLQLFMEGGVQFGVGQRTTYAQAGDIIVFDLAQSVDNLNLRFRNISTMWPRPAIEAAVPDIAHWHGRCLPPNNPSVSLLRTHMLSSYDLASQFTPPEGLRVEEATLALISAAMAGEHLDESMEQPPALKEVLTYQIKRYIRQNLSACDQTPAQIARHFGVSRRQLYQLLEPVGGIASYQRNLRLHRCLHDLKNPENIHLQISEIAYRWGFGNIGTFNRNFRAAFGISPSEARCKGIAAIRTATPDAHEASTQKTRQAEHQQWLVSIGM